MLGTRCHMLAMYVVLESYLGMVCDYPAAYEGQPGFEFLKIVPTTWDETRVLNAELGKYITIARKKNNDWFIGSINNSEARQISTSLDFLPGGKYKATIYTDAPDAAKNPDHLVKVERIVSNDDKLSIKMAAGGGSAIHIRLED